MSDLPPSPLKPTYSCRRCSERKVKCDRKRPCTACSRHAVECVFNPSPPARNTHKRLLNAKVLTDRLRYYEALLREKGVDLASLDETQPSEVSPGLRDPGRALPTPSKLGSRQSASKAQVIGARGCFKVIDNILWTRVVQEFHEPRDALGHSADDIDGLEDRVLNSDVDLVLATQPNNNLTHPPPKDILQLWQVFVNNIDPLTKIVHVPTLQFKIKDAANDTRTVSRDFEALLFAIYTAAVMSMSDGECVLKLGEPQETLLDRYALATKAALSAAKFMGTTSLPVLQALVIYIIAVRNVSEPRAIWSLTGVAVRIAQSMGLDRDGEQLGLSPFDTEIRRRIWWQIKIHDFRAAELCGMAKFQDLELHPGPQSPKWPANVDDVQLHPDMTSPPVEPSKLTDAAFISLKCELLKYTRNHFSDIAVHQTSVDKSVLDETAQDLEQLLESKYLRYCDPCKPLHLMAMLMARCSINGVRLLKHHPRRWADDEQSPTPSERQRIWEICLSSLEQNNMLQSNPLLQPFAWHAPYFQQWHAIIHVLDGLNAEPLKMNADRAWSLIVGVYQNNPDLVLHMSRPIYRAVGSLCLKAYRKREDALIQDEIGADSIRLLEIPPFIVQLRRKHEAIKTGGQDPETKDNSKPGSRGLGTGNTEQSNTNGPHDNMVHDTTQFFQLDQNPDISNQQAHHLNFDSPLTRHHHYSEMCETLDDSSIDAITWGDWDSLLAESRI